MMKSLAEAMGWDQDDISTTKTRHDGCDRGRRGEQRHEDSPPSLTQPEQHQRVPKQENDEAAGGTRDA